MAWVKTRARWRRGLVSVAALSCVGLLSLALLSSPARAGRPAAGRTAASCANGGSVSGIFTYGGGARLVSETNRSVCATGRLTVTFAGDPGAGCAAHGLCGYAGTETWTPGPGGNLSVTTSGERHGRRLLTATMVLGGFGNPVRAAVQRSRANGTTTACSDSSQDQGGFFTLPVRGGRVTVGLRHADQPLLGSRCAGPLDDDVAAALPARTVSVRELLRGRARVDLTGGGSFSAPGLAGRVRSTIVLVLGRPHRSSATARTPNPPGVKRSRLVTVTYRVTHVGGRALAAVRASPDAAVCGPFDACGLAGVIDVAPGPAAGGAVLLSAIAPRRRPRRDLLTAVGVGRGGDSSGIGVQGGGAASIHGGVTADLTQAGICRDRVGLPQAEIQLRRHKDRLQISLSPAASPNAEPLRTRCPGPELGAHQLTGTSVALSVLRHPSFTVALHGGSFSDGPYRVTTRSTITLTLRRTRIRTQIVP